MNEDLLKLCQLNALDEHVDEYVEEPELKKWLQKRIVIQAKLVTAKTPPEKDDD